MGAVELMNIIIRFISVHERLLIFARLYQIRFQIPNLTRLPDTFGGAQGGGRGYGLRAARGDVRPHGAGWPQPRQLALGVAVVRLVSSTLTGSAAFSTFQGPQDPDSLR